MAGRRVNNWLNLWAYGIAPGLGIGMTPENPAFSLSVDLVVWEIFLKHRIAW